MVSPSGSQGGAAAGQGQAACSSPRRGPSAAGLTFLLPERRVGAAKLVGARRQTGLVEDLSVDLLRLVLGVLLAAAFPGRKTVGFIFLTYFFPLAYLIPLAQLYPPVFELWQSWSCFRVAAPASTEALWCHHRQNPALQPFLLLPVL